MDSAAKKEERKGGGSPSSYHDNLYHTHKRGRGEVSYALPPSSMVPKEEKRPGFLFPKYIRRPVQEGEGEEGRPPFRRYAFVLERRGGFYLSSPPSKEKGGVFSPASPFLPLVCLLRHVGERLIQGENLVLGGGGGSFSSKVVRGEEGGREKGEDAPLSCLATEKEKELSLSTTASPRSGRREKREGDSCLLCNLLRPNSTKRKEKKGKK